MNCMVFPAADWQAQFFRSHKDNASSLSHSNAGGVKTLWKREGVPLLILGIDPGYAIVGFGLVESIQGKYRLAPFSSKWAAKECLSVCGVISLWMPALS